MTRRGIATGLLAALCVAVGGNSAAASEVEYVQVPPTIEAVPIATPNGRDVFKGEEPAKGHTFTFSVDVSACLGPTVLREVKVVERPASAARLHEGHGKATIITAVVEHQAYVKPVEKVGTEYRTACPAIASIITKRIKLERPVARVAFFDGSFSPPRRIWPVIEYGSGHP